MPSTGPLVAPATPVDISRCEHEPVRIPGAIQPDGVLLALSAADLTIVGASDNARVLLGVAPTELLGRHFTCLAHVADVGELSGGLGHERVEEDNPFKVTVHGGRRLNAIVHRHGDRVLVELEPEDDAPEFRTSYVFNRVRQSLVRLRAAADLGDLGRRAAREARELTGFDRVIVYTFQPDWSGRVVAEDCVDGATRYLDLRFPTSDIPSQARALYAECRLRMIPTSTYEPARLLMSQDGPPLDLTRASLRSISPVHLEYMRNMGALPVLKRGAKPESAVDPGVVVLPISEFGLIVALKGERKIPADRMHLLRMFMEHASVAIQSSSSPSL
jgi:chemotaxis family two-component system sensor kinase Cph1